MIRRRVVLVVALAVLSVAARGEARPVRWARASTFEYDRKVIEALRVMESGRYVKAREMAEIIFESNPDSYQTWYLMGLVMERAESNLPRALFYLTGARARLEKAYGGEDVPDDGPWWMHARLLIDLAELSGQLDNYEEELRILDTYNKLYRPPRKAIYAWPLMKLGRYDEARQKLEEALRERPDDEETQEVGLNSLGAIESELDHPEKAYQIFLDLIEKIKAHPNWSLEATYFHNAAETAISMLKFKDAERLLLEGTRHFRRWSYTNPWEQLALIYITEGRLAEAISAVRRMHEWAHSTEPVLEQQRWSGQQQATAATLLAAGYDEEALSLMRRTLNRPDRRGGISTHPDQTEISTLVFHRELLKMESERYNEHLSWCTWGEWWRLQAARVENAREIWSTSSRAASMIVAHDRLEWSLRPYATDSRILEWHRTSLHEIVGEGVVAVAVRKLLDRVAGAGGSGDDARNREHPYLLAALGEADVARGALPSAIESLSSALHTLPDAERLLRARLTALLGECYERQGDEARAMTCYRQTLEYDPHVVRALGMALPVAIESDGSEAGTRAAGWLHHSPRFNDVGHGFTIRVGATDTGMSAALLYPDGTIFCTAAVPSSTDTRSTARALCQEFHNRAFMPHLDMSQTDINSLDGSNETGDTNRKNLLKAFGVTDSIPQDPSPTPGGNNGRQNRSN